MKNKQIEKLLKAFFILTGLLLITSLSVYLICSQIQSRGYIYHASIYLVSISAPFVIVIGSLLNRISIERKDTLKQYANGGEVQSPGPSIPNWVIHPSMKGEPLEAVLIKRHFGKECTEADKKMIINWLNRYKGIRIEPVISVRVKIQELFPDEFNEVYR